MTARLNSAAGGRGPLFCLGALALALFCLTAAGPWLHRQLGGWALIGIFAATAAGAFAASRLGERTRPHAALAIIVLGAAAMRAGLLMTPPYLSSDIYRYVWDGRVAGAGINPYRYIPDAPELARLRDAAIFPNINRATYAPTIYPPVAQAIFLVMTRLSESVLAMRVGMVALEVVVCASLVGLLRRLGAPLARVALYAWHPLPIWEIAGNGHVDAAMLALLMLGLLLHAVGRNVASGVAVTLAALVKPTAALALPVLWKPWDWRLPLVVAVTAFLAYLPYLSVGWGVLGYLGGYLEEEGMTNGSGYKLLSLIESFAGELPHGAAVYVGSCCLLLLLLALAVGLRRDRSLAAAVAGLNWLLIAVLVLSSPHYPWYFLALVPALALHATATAWVLTVASVLFYNAMPEVGALPSYVARTQFFTLLTLLALAFDLWARRRSPSTASIGGTP
jgi:alpha-1,6-mannosyltransferase